MTNDGIIALHELVAVKSWADSSRAGPSIKVLLASRDSLAIFDKVTKRAGKRAGQRYHSVWMDGAGDTQVAVMDLWFSGANWAHQDGASVKFTVVDLDSFRDGTIELERDDAPVYYWLTLVQIDEDEKPVDQKKAEVMDQLKGGPRSKRVAMLCQQKDFQAYVQYRTNVECSSMDGADAWVKDQCLVASKRDFDHNPDAWSMFQARVMSPFLRWGEGSRWSDEGEIDS